MAEETKRGCGYRKVGGLYLCGSGISVGCDGLPFPIEYCPTCGAGIKFTQGFTWLNWKEFAGEHLPECSCPKKCYICYPDNKTQPYGLLWVGEAYYSPKSFIKEALEMGVSKRIPFIPKELKLGETVILLAHKKAIAHLPTPKEMNNKYEVSNGEEGRQYNVFVAPEELPGIFYAFIPKAVEMPIWESELTEEKKDELKKRGITPILIPDGDVDHSNEKTATAYDPVTKTFSKVVLLEE